jgi:hypothetical protein
MLWSQQLNREGIGLRFLLQLSVMRAALIDRHILAR